jgi:paraquat-inducible protein B
MTDESSKELDRPERDELPRPVVKRRRRFSASLIWLVPALAAVIGLSLIINSVLQAGPEITITFQTAEGLDAGKTPVKYKNVVIGKVDKISLSEDRSHVKVSVALDKSAKSFATQGTRFWVVRPRIGIGGVSGIDTLLSGAFIGADVGDSKVSQEDFKGLETPPAVNHSAPGRSFVLHSDDLGSLDIGSPVYYRRIQVGRVVSYRLDQDGKGVSMQIFVDGPNDKFVTTASRFWNASGVDVSLGADGLKLNTESLATVVAGGMAFQDPPGPHDATPAGQDAQFQLFADQGTAMAPPDGTPHYIRMRFEKSMRGLDVNAPVEFLGVKIGNVVSVRLDYDEKTQTFPLIVGAVVYPQRLGSAYDKLQALVKARGENPDMTQMMGRLVDHGLRAQARTGNLLTGQLYISMDFVKNAPKVAFDMNARPLVIPTTAGSFDKLQEQAAEIVDKIDKIPFEAIGNNLNQTLAGLSATLKQVNGKTLPELDNTMKGVQKTVNTAGDALSGDSPLQQNLGTTLQEVQRAARSLRVLVDYLGDHPEALIRGRSADAKPDRAAAPPASTPSPQQGSKP